MKRSKQWIVVATLLMLSAIPSFSQLKLPRASQHSVLTQTVGLTDVTITYSRPGVKGRSVWGTLVPYDQVWRTGANEATIISFSDDVTINGQPLKAGSYSLHTIPGKSSWTIIFNQVDKQWGSYSYDKSKDALRVTTVPEPSAFHEWLTFDVPEISTDSAKIAIRWEKIAVPFTVGTHTREQALASIRTSLIDAKSDDWRTPYAAAQYAYDNNVDATQAAQWLDRSLAVNQNVTNLWFKARQQFKAGDKAAARTTAELALSKATDKDKEVSDEIRRTIVNWN
jgi:hypothetical protein